MSASNQYQLLRQRRFAPYFITQFLGAFNDNVFKNALLVMIAFQVQDSLGLSSHTLINLAAGLFILPFFLFSARAGWLADRADKALMMRRVKLAEIAIMAAGALGLWLGHVPFLIGVLFLMGTQSAFFGPLKYGLLPQHLHRNELIGGNGLVGMGTFVAILLGTIAGSKMIVTEYGATLVALSVLLLAALGYASSRAIPAAPPCPQALIERRNTWQLLRDLQRNRSAFFGVLGLSWFWFVGATYLAQFPNFVKLVIGGSVDVFTLLLCCFSIGIGLGALACERLSAQRVEVGLVPLGALLLSLFGIDLALTAPSTPLGNELALGDYLAASGGWRMAFDTLAIGAGGGLFAVPLNALVQQRSAPECRARVIAANNVLNALLMVLSAAFAIVLLGAGLSIAELFLITALANLLALLALALALCEVPLRCAGWLLSRLRYRLREPAAGTLAESGAQLIRCASEHPHAALLLLSSLPRPALWLFETSQLHGIGGWLWRRAGACERGDSIATAALIEAALARGELVCLMGAATVETGPHAAAVEIELRLDGGRAQLHSAPVNPT